MLLPAYPIETARLTLRPFLPTDLDDALAYQGDPEVTLRLLWGPRDRDEVAGSIGVMGREDALREEGDVLTLAVIWREIGRVVGHVELVWTSREHEQGELGAVFTQRYQGKGLATEAMREVLRLGFDAAGLHRIVGRCDTRNTASAALMERLGMRREAHFVSAVRRKGEWSDQYVYALLDDEWREREAVSSPDPAAGDSRTAG